MATTNTDPKLAELNRTFDRLAMRLSRTHLHHHTIQILNVNKGGTVSYKPGGSGVLVQQGGRYFIFTAAHVTGDVATDGLFVNTRIGVRPIEATLDETDYHRDGMVDIAYLELEPHLAQLLTETYTFLPFEKIEARHVPPDQAGYMVSGYPEVNIDVDPATHTVTTGSSHFLLSMANDKPYEYHQIPRDACFALNFGGAGTDLESGAKEKGIKDPHGISGCGLWRLIPSWPNGRMSLDYRLIGIMFLVRRVKYHVLVGNRIELITDRIEP
jgi:hypothetical protein